jgi:hypothetical protein
MFCPKRNNPMSEERRTITADDLKVVKEGFEAVVAKLYSENRGSRGLDFDLRQFALVLRMANELAAKVGGIAALADCAETLHDLKGQ